MKTYKPTSKENRKRKAINIALLVALIIALTGFSYSLFCIFSLKNWVLWVIFSLVLVTATYFTLILLVFPLSEKEKTYTIKNEYLTVTDNLAKKAHIYDLKKLLKITACYHRDKIISLHLDFEKEKTRIYELTDNGLIDILDLAREVKR